MKPAKFYSSKAWKYCSKYVLLFYSDGLIARCFTCGKPLQINTKEAQCGHLIKYTDSKATALEFTNLGVQCSACNRYHGGRQDIMKDQLTLMHGEKEIEKLYIKRHNFCKLDKVSLDYWARYYKKLFNDLVKVKGNPWKR